MRAAPLPVAREPRSPSHQLLSPSGRRFQRPIHVVAGRRTTARDARPRRNAACGRGPSRREISPAAEAAGDGGEKTRGAETRQGRGRGERPPGNRRDQGGRGLVGRARGAVGLAQGDAQVAVFVEGDGEAEQQRERDAKEDQRPSETTGGLPACRHRPSSGWGRAAREGLEAGARRTPTTSQSARPWRPRPHPTRVNRATASANPRPGNHEDRPAGRSHQWLPAGLRWPQLYFRRIMASRVHRSSQESRIRRTYPQSRVTYAVGRR